MRFISALVMPFKGELRVVAHCFFASLLVLSCSTATAELIDRVIAYVDDRAITLREFDDLYNRTLKIKPDITREEVLNTLINRILLLREARRLKIEAPNDEELLKEYIELRVKTFIRIKEEDIRDFYNSNPEFKGLSYDSVRDRIEDYLVQQELNRLLKRHIEELRSQSFIKVIEYPFRSDE